MKKTDPQNVPSPATADWRIEAEEAGRAAFEAAVAETTPTPEPLTWLREYQHTTRKPQ